MYCLYQIDIHIYIYFFFFNDTATTEIYTLSLHDALPICRPVDKQGFADGSWTPETLADEISSIEANEKGIETRAVQVWFQDN